ncbi:MAG: hypothetical protein M1820_006690 [Bogoriella megaspora]|nr:MAG: hypothetical protein M1820_006690 [Bogoriella megaspora]
MFLPPDPASVLFDSTRHEHSDLIQDRKQQLRKSRSHDSLIAPFVQFVRNPTRALESIIESFRSDEDAEQKGWEEAERESEKRILYHRLGTATSYVDWHEHASELDELEGNNAWKQEEDSQEYNFELVKSRLKQLDEARISCDVGRMLFLIRTSLIRSLGAMGDIRLYKHSHVGTKELIERYIESACQTISKLLELSNQQTEGGNDSRLVLEKILAARQAFGRSALLLSGGGTFGMNHIGVVKALWQTQLLPRIVSGSSAGSIVCSVLCTKTDAELPAVIQEFCYGELDVFEKEGEEETVVRKAVRFLKHGNLFDIGHLIRVMRNLLGDMTFQEAYNRTRRILNICVSSASLYELPRILNYVTAPNVLIWSAVAASCSVPFVFSAASLLAKDPKTGTEVPWNPSQSHWIDGSVDNDLPITRLAELFNVNHFIVSQVNPHVVPFLKDDDTIGTAANYSSSAVTTGSGWLHTMAGLAKGEALHRMHVMAELGIFPNVFTKCRSVLSQRYAGDITIFPEIPYSQFPKVLKNPTTEFMLQAMLSGERATWPKLSRIKNHCAIELALDDAVQQLRARVVFSPSQVDLRLNTFAQSEPAGGSSAQGLERRSRLRRRQRIVRSNESSQVPAPYRKSATVNIPPPQHIHHSKSRDEHASTPILASAPPNHTFTHAPKYPGLPPDVLSSEGETLLSPSSIADGEIDKSGNEDGADDLLSISTDSSDDSLQTSTDSPLPSLWPTSRLLFSSASQPTTPSLEFQTSSFQNLSQSSPTASHRTRPLKSIHIPTLDGVLHSPELEERTPHVTIPSNRDIGPSNTRDESPRPSSSELKYKRIFHGSTSASSPGLTRPSSDHLSPDIDAYRRFGCNEGDDLSGTRGMVRRRRSLTTGLKGPTLPGRQ